MINRVRSKLRKFFHNPSYAIYSRRRTTEQRQWTAEYAPKSFESDVVATHSPPLLPPKIVWMFWAQGEESAPDLVRACIESWRHHNPGWDIRVLDQESSSQWVELPSHFKQFGWTLYSDLLRLALLQTYGGVWADATLLCHRPLDEWLPLQLSTGFFAFSDAPPNRDIEVWFLASTAENALIEAWLEDLSAYLTAVAPHPVPYFTTNYIQQWRLAQMPRNERDATAQMIWRKRSVLPAKPCILLSRTLQWNASERLFQSHLAAGLPVSKLSYKVDLPLERLKSMGLVSSGA